MKVPFTLKPDQKLILRILLGTGKIHYSTLEHILTIQDTSDFDSFVKTFARRRDFDYRPALQKSGRTCLERTLEGLVFVDLVETEWSSKGQIQNYTSYSGLVDTDSGLTDDLVSLTTEGERVAGSIKDARRLTLRPALPQRTTVFVACAFGHDDVDLLYEKHLASASELLHYEPVRVDLTEPKKSITDAILEGVSECACVIADLTYARPSVYFEVGLAHGLGIPLLLTCRSDHNRGKSDDRKVHFDLEQYKISYWTRTPNGSFRWSKKNMKPAMRLPTLVPKRTENE